MKIYMGSLSTRFDGASLLKPSCMINLSAETGKPEDIKIGKKP